MEDRQTWLKEKLKLHVDEYATNSNLNVVVASWNVNSKLPGKSAYDSTKIFEWLHLSSDPDIVAIGLQEVEMTAQAMIKQETDSGKDWLVLLEKELQNAKSKYENIVSKQLVGLFLCVFLKTEHKKNLTDLRIQQVAVGAMNKFGNKVCNLLSCVFFTVSNDSYRVELGVISNYMKILFASSLLTWQRIKKK